MTLRFSIRVLAWAVWTTWAWAGLAGEPAPGRNPAEFGPEQFGFIRLFRAAEADPKWKDAKLLTDRIWLVRSYAMKEAVVSAPVSDRYMITCYGGPVDLVHFFCLAANLCSGGCRMGERLHEEWVAEGGFENLHGFNYQQPPEAHPDDLPSNAFGALFGWEIREHQQDLAFDLELAFSKFVAPLRPVPDAIAKEFSHRAIVMGLPENASQGLREERRAWFTAVPLVLCRDLNAMAIRKVGKPACGDVGSGEAALAAAGFQVYEYKGRPIIIRRMKAVDAP